ATSARAATRRSGPALATWSSSPRGNRTSAGTGTTPVGSTATAAAQGADDLSARLRPMNVDLIDGTYELFRHHYGLPSAVREKGSRTAATRGVLTSVVAMLEEGATHVGVATDHVIESFRNDMWPGYKSSLGMPEDLLAQFPLLEEALAAAGVAVWAMVEQEADDGLAAAAAMADADPNVEQVRIHTVDKDLAQCVQDNRVVQVDRRKQLVFDVAGVQEKFGVLPTSIPDWLGLVGDSAD